MYYGHYIVSKCRGKSINHKYIVIYILFLSLFSLYFFARKPPDSGRAVGRDWRPAPDSLSIVRRRRWVRSRGSSRLWGPRTTHALFLKTMGFVNFPEHGERDPHGCWWQPSIGTVPMIGSRWWVGGGGSWKWGPSIVRGSRAKCGFTILLDRFFFGINTGCHIFQLFHPTVLCFWHAGMQT